MAWQALAAAALGYMASRNNKKAAQASANTQGNTTATPGWQKQVSDITGAVSDIAGAVTAVRGAKNAWDGSAAGHEPTGTELGQRTKDFYDTFAPDSTQWERMGAQQGDGGAATIGMQSLQNQQNEKMSLRQGMVQERLGSLAAEAQVLSSMGGNAQKQEWLRQRGREVGTHEGLSDYEANEMRAGLELMGVDTDQDRLQHLAALDDRQLAQQIGTMHMQLTQALMAHAPKTETSDTGHAANPGAFIAGLLGARVGGGAARKALNRTPRGGRPKANTRSRQRPSGGGGADAERIRSSGADTTKTPKWDKVFDSDRSEKMRREGWVETTPGSGIWDKPAGPTGPTAAGLAGVKNLKTLGTEGPAEDDGNQRGIIGAAQDALNIQVPMYAQRGEKTSGNEITAEMAAEMARNKDLPFQTRLAAGRYLELIAEADRRAMGNARPTPMSLNQALEQIRSQQ